MTPPSRVIKTTLIHKALVLYYYITILCKYYQSIFEENNCLREAIVMTHISSQAHDLKNLYDIGIRRDPESGREHLKIVRPIKINK